MLIIFGVWVVSIYIKPLYPPGDSSFLCIILFLVDGHTAQLRLAALDPSMKLVARIIEFSGQRCQFVFFFGPCGAASFNDSITKTKDKQPSLSSAAPETLHSFG